MKTKAVIEVVIVFALTLLLAALAGITPFAAWIRSVTRRAFLEYVVMMAVPLILLLVTRRDLPSYGLSLRKPAYHLGIAATAFLPIALAYVPFAWLDYTKWSGSLIVAGIDIALLFVLGWLLRLTPTMNESGVMLGGLMLLGLYQKASLGNALSAIVFYIFFLGIGEELLFRGYIQSRLNAAFGRPFKFFGVSWGWGALLTALLFGLMHVINTGSFIRGAWQLQPWWGLWTVFGGLISGYLREKTGSIAAPALLHGLPQAIAYSFMGL